jgi:hypothetical protein
VGSGLRVMAPEPTRDPGPLIDPGEVSKWCEGDTSTFRFDGEPSLGPLDTRRWSSSTVSPPKGSGAMLWFRVPEEVVRRRGSPATTAYLIRSAT